MLKSIDEIRSMFLDFFKKKNHHVVASSSLVPDIDDSSILFTNSGMNQFKNIFLGIKEPLYKEIVSIQRCLRISGKHNDLKSVGYSPRHNTFFEMMGNFSFSSYFKKEAILYAWELLTEPNWFNLPKKNLFVTVNILDKESYYIWEKVVKIPKERIFVLGDKKNFFKNDNFWKMSEFGLCGPSTEIFYDFSNGKYLGEFNSNNSINYLEIWNIVFMEFNHELNGDFISLSKKSVDTGMGLERITSILQGVRSNFEIDIFQELIFTISNFVDIKINHLNKYIFYIISDHIRAVIYLIYDNIIPSGNHRGYILRKLIRRILIHIDFLKVKKDFHLYDLFYSVFNKKLSFFKIELFDNNFLLRLKKILNNEQKKFLFNLKRGLNLLNYYIYNLKGKKFLESKIIYMLYDTFGLPLDVIKDVCKNSNIEIDLSKFENKLFAKKKKSSYQISYNNNIFSKSNKKKFLKTKFLGYLNINNIKSKIIAILDEENNLLNKTSLNKKKLIFILKDTIFCPKLGGQQNDVGFLFTSNKLNKFIINDVITLDGYILHIGYIKYGSFSVYDYVILQYDEFNRRMLSCNHTASHLLYYSLNRILKFPLYKYSCSIKNNLICVDFFYLFDISDKDIKKIEYLVNLKISKSFLVEEFFLDSNNNNNVNNIFDLNIPYLKCKISNNYVRLVKINDVSEEQCYGLHVQNTKDIKYFVIYKIYNIKHGVKRIEAISSDYAFDYLNKQRNIVKKFSKMFSSEEDNLYLKVCLFLKKNKDLLKRNKIILNMYLDNTINLLSNSKIFMKNKKNFLIKDISDIKLYQNMSYIILNVLKKKFNLEIIILIKLKSDHLIFYILGNKVFFLRNNIKEFCSKIISFFYKKNSVNQEKTKISRNFIILKIKKNNLIFFKEKLCVLYAYIKSCIY